MGVRALGCSPINVLRRVTMQPGPGLSRKQRLHQSIDNTCERKLNMDGRYITQTELAERWGIETGAPVLLKLGCQVRYRVRGVETFEAKVLCESIKSHGAVAPKEPDDQRKIIIYVMPLVQCGPSPSDCVQYLATPAFVPRSQHKPWCIEARLR